MGLRGRRPGLWAGGFAEGEAKANLALTFDNKSESAH